MEAYTGFATVYDMFMDNVPYEQWGHYLLEILGGYQIDTGTILDLGCGTGCMTEFLAEKGYDMIGVDSSEEMLNIALEKKDISGHDILYVRQDMRNLELYGMVDAVISICDSMNYITEEEDLLQVFRRVNQYLAPGGIFIFDMNTAHKYEEIGDGVIAENRENGSFIWENYYDAEEMMNEYDLTLYIEDEAGKYDRYEETHCQRAYTAEKIKELIEKAGLAFVKAAEAFSGNEISEDSDRMYVIAKEIQKGRRKYNE